MSKAKKRRMKRPEKRTEIITIRVTPTEKKALDTEAKKHFRNLTLEAYKRLVDSLVDDGIIEGYDHE